jgi:two-component system cell cycle sensor histidine kinase/response regulator CckA
MNSAMVGTEMVLVVEDEPIVRKAACRILQLHGYRVLEATNGEEAIVAMQASDTPVDLVITDVVMPGMEGTTLVSYLRTSHPRTRVLYMSGYNPEYLQVRAAPDEAFLAKPFTFEGLAQRVREVLDGQ